MGTFWVRPRSIGDYDGASVYTNSGVTTFQITDLQMIGVHANESAYFTMRITDFNTGEVKYSKTFTEDVKGKSFDVSNAIPGRTYHVVLESHTNNDCDGGFWITVDGYAYQ